MKQTIKTGLVFLRKEMIEAHVKNLEFKEGIHFIELPRLATEEEQKEEGVLEKKLTEGWGAYVYKWRFSTKKEQNEVIKRNGGVFVSI